MSRNRAITIDDINESCDHGVEKVEFIEVSLSCQEIFSSERLRNIIHVDLQRCITEPFTTSMFAVLPKLHRFRAIGIENIVVDGFPNNPYLRHVAFIKCNVKSLYGLRNTPWINSLTCTSTLDNLHGLEYLTDLMSLKLESTIPYQYSVGMPLIYLINSEKIYVRKNGKNIQRWSDAFLQDRLDGLDKDTDETFYKNKLSKAIDKKRAWTIVDFVMKHGHLHMHHHNNMSEIVEKYISPDVQPIFEQYLKNPMTHNIYLTDYETLVKHMMCYFYDVPQPSDGSVRSDIFWDGLNNAICAPSSVTLTGRINAIVDLYIAAHGEIDGPIFMDTQIIDSPQYSKKSLRNVVFSKKITQINRLVPKSIPSTNRIVITNENVEMQFQENPSITSMDWRAGVLRTDVLRSFPNLEVLVCENNNLVDVEAVAVCTKLQSLNIGKNNITSLEPLCNLRRLRNLFCDHNNITSIEPLRDLTKLTTLDIAHNMITNVDSLENCENLLSFYFYHNPIEEMISLYHLPFITGTLPNGLITKYPVPIDYDILNATRLYGSLVDIKFSESQKRIKRKYRDLVMRHPEPIDFNILEVKQSSKLTENAKSIIIKKYMKRDNGVFTFFPYVWDLAKNDEKVMDSIFNLTSQPKSLWKFRNILETIDPFYQGMVHVEINEDNVEYYSKCDVMPSVNSLKYCFRKVEYDVLKKFPNTTTFVTSEDVVSMRGVGRLRNLRHVIIILSRVCLKSLIHLAKLRHLKCFVTDPGSYNQILKCGNLKFLFMELKCRIDLCRIPILKSLRYVSIDTDRTQSHVNSIFMLPKLESFFYNGQSEYHTYKVKHSMCTDRLIDLCLDCDLVISPSLLHQVRYVDCDDRSHVINNFNNMNNIVTLHTNFVGKRSKYVAKINNSVRFLTLQNYTDMIDFLANCCELETLYFSIENRLEHWESSILTNLVNLRSIILTGPDSKMVLDIKHLQKMSGLQKIDVNNVTIENIEYLSGLTNLSTFECCNSSVNLDIFGVSLPNIKIIKLVNVSVLSDIEDIILVSNTLQSLHISPSTIKKYHTLYVDAPNLLSIKISRCLFLNANINCPRTCCVDIKGSDKKTSSSSFEINCPNAHKIHLNKCKIKHLKISPMMYPGEQSININDNRLMNLDCLEGHRFVTELKCSRNRLQNIDGLAKCTIMENLNISTNKITSIEPLRNLFNLRSLNCSTNSIQALDPIVYLTRLRTLRKGDYCLGKKIVKSIQVKRFLEFFNNHKTQFTIYQDSENIQNVMVEKTIGISIQNLLRDDPQKFKFDDLKTAGVEKSVINTIMERCANKATFYHITYQEMFKRVWNRIVKHPDHQELIRILEELIVESRKHCHRGAFNRTVSVLVGFCDDINIGISDEQNISAIILRTRSQIIPYCPERCAEISRQLLLEAGFDELHIAPWIQAILDDD